MILILISIQLFFISLANAETLQIEIELPSRPSEVKILTENNFIDADYRRLKDRKYLIYALTEDEPKSYTAIAKIGEKLFFSKFKNHKKLSIDKIANMENSIGNLEKELDEQSSSYSKLKNTVFKELDLNTEDILEFELEKKENDKLNWIHSNLKRLIKFPRKDEKEVYKNTKTVSEHLKKAARTTAKTQRIGIRRRKAALKRLKRELKIAQSIHPSDLYDLNNELITLKKQREELENSLFDNQF